MNAIPLCRNCKSFNGKDRVLNCYIANSIIEFCRNHKVNVYIIECKEFRAKAKFDVVEFHGGEK